MMVRGAPRPGYAGIALVCLALSAGGLLAHQAGNPVVVIDTSVGDITVELFEEQAPVTVDNFLGYAKSGFYAGTIFHRVIRGFMVQGGGLDVDLTRKETRPPVKNEATNGLKNTRGTMAMARTAEVRSATSQFFINTVDNPSLDHKGPTPSAYGYAVFGRVIAGMDVVDKIEGASVTTKGSHSHVPVEPIVIRSVKVKAP